MILIFGSTGYMGSAVAAECDRRSIKWMYGRRELSVLKTVDQMAKKGTALAINCAAFIPNPTVDACKTHQEETILGNVHWPSVLRDACEVIRIPMIHLSTGCLFDEHREYSEDDRPTRGWDGYCGFYVGTKLLSEKLVREYSDHYILRLRLPFGAVDHHRNYLTKLMRFKTVFQHVNSLTHRGDFAKWALDLWAKGAPFGTYHCVNTGQISAEGLVLKMGMDGMLDKQPEFIKSPGTTGARLSNAKLAAAIGPIRTVHDAVADSLKNWRKR